MIDNNPHLIDHQFEATQVKEKYGTLRFYYFLKKIEDRKVVDKLSTLEAELEGAISFAQHLSENICEICGNQSKVHGTFWLTTECEECERKKDENN
jgi:hypothetical protein